MPINEPQQQPENKKLSLDAIKPIFQGTGKRNEMMKKILQISREQLPMNQKKFINFVAFVTGLTPRKVCEDYIQLMIDVEVLQMQGSNYELGNNERGL